MREKIRSVVGRARGGWLLLALVILAPLLVVLYIATADSAPGPATARVTSTARPERPAARAQRAAAPHPSGGLGLSIAEWERAHGKPGPTGFAEDGYPITPTSYYKVYSELSTKRVFRIEHLIRYVEDLGPAREEARAAAPGLLPSDARLVESVPADGVYPESQLYESEYLRKRFAAADPVVVWGRTKPGTLTVEYLEVQDGGMGYYTLTRVSTGDSRVGR